MTQQLERSTFFDDAIKAFGHLDAQELGFVLIESLESAQARLPIVKPITGVRLMVSRLAVEVVGFAHADGTIDLAFSPDVNPEYMLQVTPEVIEHEVAHVAHKQHSPNFFEEASPATYLFAAAISEGIAEHAVEAMLDPFSAGDFAISFDDADKALAMAEQLIRNPLPSQEQWAKYYAFLDGQLDFPLRGYELGKYIVSAVVNDHGHSMKQLMRAPVSEYERFVTEELL